MMTLASKEDNGFSDGEAEFGKTKAKVLPGTVISKDFLELEQD